MTIHTDLIHHLFHLFISVFVACGPVCVCCCQNHWKHCTGHHAAGLHVCLHWSPTFQSEMRWKKKKINFLITIIIHINYQDTYFFSWRQLCCFPRASFIPALIRTKWLKRHASKNFSVWWWWMLLQTFLIFFIFGKLLVKKKKLKVKKGCKNTQFSFYQALYGI